MKLAVSQPYFFPYIGMFQLIYATDFFVVLDTVKFKKDGWMHRNRILHPNKNFDYITLPTKKEKGSSTIKNITIFDDKEKWKQVFLGRLSYYANKAPYYKSVKELLVRCLEIDEVGFSKTAMMQIKMICDYIGIDFSYDFLSKMEIALPKIEQPDEWSLYIASAIGAKRYINMPRGATFFNEEKFKKKDIELRFLQPILREYDQKRESFIPRLSIIDVLMWNSKEEVLDMIRNDFDILTKQELLQKEHR